MGRDLATGAGKTLHIEIGAARSKQPRTSNAPWIWKRLRVGTATEADFTGRDVEGKPCSSTEFHSPRCGTYRQ